jgi:hypothetical protein
MTTNNYILARWRGAITDPPEHIKNVIIRQKEKDDAVGYWSLTYCQWHDLFGESFEVEPGDQWLDITTVPGVAREAVQAAVDEMTVRYWEGAECILHEVGERDHCEGCALDQYPLPLCKSLACIAHHACVTPMEVTNG